MVPGFLNPEAIMTTYNCVDVIAKTFAFKNGFKRKFSSTFMRYSGEAFDLPELSIRNYCDEMRALWDKTANERLVYTQDGEVVGYAHFDGNELGSISIKSEHPGQWLGKNFVKYICGAILSDGNITVDLYCVVGNKASLHRQFTCLDK